MGTFVTEQFDSVYPSYPDTITEIYVYKFNSITIATVTIIYVDSTKERITSIVRS